MITALRFAIRDIVGDWRRSLTHVAAIVPIVAAYLILNAVAGGLRGEALAVEAQNIVLLSPNALDPAAGRLDPAVLDVVRDVGGSDVRSATPMIFRPIRMADRIVQLRAAPQESWESIHDLTLLSGSWPAGGDEVAITEGIAIATDWDVGTRAEIFGTTFRVAALVRAPGTKFASVWMDYDRADRLFEGQSGFQMVTIEPAADVDAATLLDRFDAVSGDEFSVYFESDLAERQSARSGAAQSLARVAAVIGVAALVFGGFNLAALALAERKRDLGITRSIGFGSTAIVAVVVLRSMLLAGVGFVVGAVAASVVLGATSVATVRSFVFDAAVPGEIWAIGAAITVGVGGIGAWVAARGATRRPVRSLLEIR